jgi:CheY-like chemotaxis protein
VGEAEEMSKINVLVADDDPAMRELCQATLESSGFAVTLASSGREALRLVNELEPDAIVLDVRMPTMDGWQVAARLAQTEELRQIPVIMLTGLTDQDSLRKADLAGASDYIAKPFDPRQLSDSVHQVLELHHDDQRIDQLEHRRRVAR